MEEEILKLFKSIKFLDFANVDKELSKIKTTDGKLDYLAAKKTDHYDKYVAIVSSLNQEQYLYYLKNVDDIIRTLFSHWPLETPLQVPSFIFENQLKEDRYNQTFSNWFIDYNARTFCFDYLKEQFEENPISKRRQRLIKKELKEINEFEERAESLFDNGAINVRPGEVKPKENLKKYHDEIEFIRVDEGYYRNHNFDDNVFNVNNKTSMILAKHTYFKKYLIEEQSKFELESEVQETTDRRRFKDLFETTTLYEKAIKILIEKGFIEGNDNQLKWIFTPTKEFKTNQTIIALCVVLEIKHYFKLNVAAIYKNLEGEFNIKIDKGTFSKSRNGFKEDYYNKGTTNFMYTSMFQNIL